MKTTVYQKFLKPLASRSTIKKYFVLSVLVTFSLFIQAVSAKINSSSIDDQDIYVAADFPYAGPGLIIRLNTDEDNQVSVKVVTVLPNGPACQAGIKDGDKIISIDGNAIPKVPIPENFHSINKIPVYIKIIRSLQGSAGDKKIYEIERDGKTFNITVAVDDASTVDLAKHIIDVIPIRKKIDEDLSVIDALTLYLSEIGHNPSAKYEIWDYMADELPKSLGENSPYLIEPLTMNCVYHLVCYGPLCPVVSEPTNTNSKASNDPLDETRKKIASQYKIILRLTANTNNLKCLPKSRLEKIVTALGNLADWLDEIQDHKDAFILKKRALAVAEVAYGNDSIEIVRYLRNLVFDGRISQTDLLYQIAQKMRATEISERFDGTDSGLAASCYNNVYFDAQKLTDLAAAETFAQSLLQDSIKTDKKVSIARQVLLLAYIQTRAGEIAKANKTYEQGISYCNSNTGLGLILEEYADFLKKQKQPEKAEEVLQKLRSLKGNPKG